MRLQVDPMRELEEALMDRTMASLNRKNKITSIKTGKRHEDGFQIPGDERMAMFEPTFLQIDLKNKEQPLKIITAHQSYELSQSLFRDLNSQKRATGKCSLYEPSRDDPPSACLLPSYSR